MTAGRIARVPTLWRGRAPTGSTALTRGRALRDGAIVSGLLFLGYLFLVLAPLNRGVGLDAYAYWSLDLGDLYGAAQGAVLGAGAFRYSPLVAQLFAPLGQLPWGTFLFLYEAMLLGTIVWLGRRRWIPVLAILAFPPVAIELYYANIHLLLAAAIVLGFRHPWTWSLVLLTKITPGIGLVWFAFRREWRSLAVALGATAALVAVSWLMVPALWAEWIATLAGNRAVPTTNSVAVPLLVRLPAAFALVAWGAWSDRRWTVPVAATLALPVLWIHGLAMLVGVVPLVASERSRRTRPNEIPTPAALLGAPAGASAPRIVSGHTSSERRST